jgi:hypothetical protein
VSQGAGRIAGGGGAPVVGREVRLVVVVVPLVVGLPGRRRLAQRSCG